MSSAQLNDPKVQAIIRQICEEATLAADKRCEDFWVNLGKPGAPRHNSWSPKLQDSECWKAFKAADEPLQIAVMMAALNHDEGEQPKGLDQLWLHILTELVRRNLPFQAEHLHELLERWFGQPNLEAGFQSLPGLAILGAVERYAKDRALDTRISDMLVRLRAKARAGYLGHPANKFHRDLADRIDRLLDPTKKLPEGEFAAGFAIWLSTLKADDCGKWTALAHVAVEAGGKAKPSKKWLDQARAGCARFDPIDLAERIAQWLEETTPDPIRPDNSLDILKGMLWLSPLLHQGELAGQVGRFAEKCFRKIPQIGARSVKLGNVALWALSQMASEPRAAAELFKIKERIKTPSGRKTVEICLRELATKNGQSVEAMEDVSLPNFGLDEQSAMRFGFGDIRAELQVGSTEITHRWFGSGGRAVKSIPSEVRHEHPAELASFKQVVKEISAARAAQVLRLEQSWIEQRSWNYAEWERHFLGHPLRRPIVKSLIWDIAGRSCLAEDGELEDVRNRPVTPAPNDRVRLWHPLDDHPDDVLAWRRRIVSLGVTQPIKQAHREIYVLTDAERQTRVYSNRFAAHVLRQHQFRALCQARGWKYDLMGGWDGWNVPTRVLPAQGLSVEYHVETVEDGQHSDSYVALH